MIGLDATYSLERAPSGVGVYSREILYGIANAHQETRFGFYYRPNRMMRALGAVLPPNARRALLWERLALRGTSLFHGLNQRLPRTRLRRAVVTFHDLFVMTGEYSTPDFRARFTAQAREAAARASMIVAVSEFTKSQVVSLLGVEPSRVRVIHHGIRALPRPAPQARERLILSAGALQTRKNIARLVEAFEGVGQEWRLALIGSNGFGAEAIHARIATSAARDRIEVTGYVTAEELAAWYGRAQVFAFPSLDEGFGMPVLEAMAAGAAVLTSNRSAMPEVAGDAALLVDPLDSGALRDGLLRLTEDAELRARLIARGAARVREFTWEKAVTETWSVYREVLGERD